MVRVLATVAWCVAFARAEETVASPAITPDAVVDRGLAALARAQSGDGGYSEGAGISGLAGMAFLAGGHTPTRGRYREASARILRAVLAAQDRMTGYLGAGSGNMYAHGFATLYLAECYGMAPEVGLRRALEAAIDLIQRSQNAEGGWRYQPVPVDADISVTICQVMALRAAYNVGIGGKASQDAIGRAIQYVRGCANGDGSFAYTRGGGGGGWGTDGAEGVPRCAAGSMSLIGSGVTDPRDATLGPALAFLRRNYRAHLGGDGQYFWYGQYYTAQAMFHSPDPKDGHRDWEKYWSDAWPIMARLQRSDGMWPPSEGGMVYATAMALIILQIPNNYLPIFQR